MSRSWEHTRLACWFRRLAETRFNRLCWNRRVSDLSLLNRAQTRQIRESSYFFLLPSYHYSVPIIVFALLLFVLLAFAGVVLLSLALRYRAGTARRQARRWVASLNVWLTSFSAVFFLSFTFLLSFWIDSAFRFALIGMGCGGILGSVGLAMTR